MLLTLKCPQCQSNDIARSRRKLWERFVLFTLRAQVYRCRDCRRRFWVGVEWGKVILGALTAAVAMGVVVLIVAVYRNQEKPKPVPPPVRAKKLRRVKPLPKGLPPLSSIPAPVTGVEVPGRGDADTK
jgi:hypothetical protein